MTLALPKITGLLNNCALNCALPTLLEKINLLADLEKTSALPVDDTDIIYNHYKTLKSLFAGYYGIADVDLLTWQQFNAFVSTHSFYANEMMFAPIFRQFIATFGPENGYQSADLWLLKDIQSDELNNVEGGSNAGRYNPLDANEAMPLFHSKLGLKLKVIDDNGLSVYPGARVAPLPKSCVGEVLEISLYLKDGHYELLPHEQLKHATAQFINEISTLPLALRNIHDALSGSDTALQTNQGLGDLFVYVNTALRWNLTVGQYCVSASDYAAVGDHYHNKTPSGRQTFAVILLTISEGQKNKLASYYLDIIQHLSPSRAARRLVNAIIASEGNLESPLISIEMEAIEKNIVTLSERIKQQKNDAVNMPGPAKTNANFQLQCIIGFAAVGATLLGVAILLTIPPAISVALALAGYASLLASAGLFVTRQSENACDVVTQNNHKTL